MEVQALLPYANRRSCAAVLDSVMSEEDEFDWENYDSGPYCEHWYEPWDCDMKCDSCGHECTEHMMVTCGKEGCICKEFKTRKEDEI